VLIKSDGNYTYLTPDLAYNERKFGRGYDKIVNVLGADHQGQVPSLIGASKALGHKHDALMYILYQMVTLLKGGELMKLSTRAGTFITLRDMIEELGVGVVRFFFAMRSPDAQMTFDWDLAKDTSMENPVYYVQYAHARCCSLLRKAEKEGCAFVEFEGVDLSLLDNPEEQKIIQALGRLPEVVLAAQENLAPHMVTIYLAETAQLFHKFFTQGNKDPSLRFIVADNAALTQARLALATAIKTVLANALGILGIQPMERM
jgi:arginyl-tRNA synthetase